MDQQEIKIRSFLMDIGVDPALSGYHYLVCAIQTVIKALNRNEVQKPMMKLYAEVSKQFNTTPLRVERGIRHAKEKVFDNPTITCNEYFCALIDFESGDVSNGSFIFTLAEHLRFGGKDERAV